MAAGRVLLLTGPPGVGKTTALRAVAAALASRPPRCPRGVGSAPTRGRPSGARVHRPGGFYTEEIRVGGTRRGFRGVTFDGVARDIARVDFAGGPRVGKYGVDVAAVDALVEQALGDERDADVYLVDEIGRMECLSPRFVAAMRRLLDGATPVVATVAVRGGGFIAEVKARDDVQLLEVTRANRDTIPAAVLDWLAAS